MFALTWLLAAEAIVRPYVPTRCPTAVATAVATENDDQAWAEFEAWMSRKEEEEVPQAGRPRWTATSSGHQHEHFFSNRAQDFAALGAPPRLIDNLEALGVRRPSVAE